MKNKYRAWDKEANIMIYSDHRARKLYDVYYGFEMNGKGELECRWEGEFTESHVLDGGTLDNLMQFTGIHDKNGKEIYEGDVVKTYFALDEKIIQEPFIVGWRESRAMFEGVKHNSKKIDYLTRFDFFAEQSFIYEVIGNIYENPELLKE